jgi:uncharacterized membrane protein YccC
MNDTFYEEKMNILKSLAIGIAVGVLCWFLGFTFEESYWNGVLALLLASFGFMLRYKVGSDR